jgi:ferritin-like metal-binding protein YciE
MSQSESNTRVLFYVAGLRNAHAMETQAIELLSRQVDRLQNYPEMEAQIRKHIAESEAQRTRLEEALATLSESHSSVKDVALGFVGDLAAMAHSPASDEVLKNTLANFAFEHYEIAAYKSLIAMAEAAGHNQGLAAARASLKEEETMAIWIDEHIVPTTLQFLSRSETGVKADR